MVTEMISIVMIHYNIPEHIKIGIYEWVANTGHRYIGSSNNLKKRFNAHKKQLEQNHKETKKSNPKWQNVYNKYPNLVWNVNLIEEVKNVEQLQQIEQKHLNLWYSSTDPLCLNINPYADRPLSSTFTKKGKTWIQIMGKEKAEQKRKLIKEVMIKSKTGKTWEQIMGEKKALAKRQSQSQQRINTGKKYRWKHPVHGEVTSSIPELVRLYSLRDTGLHSIKKGKYKQYKQWIFLGS